MAEEAGKDEAEPAAPPAPSLTIKTDLDEPPKITIETSLPPPPVSHPAPQLVYPGPMAAPLMMSQASPPTTMTQLHRMHVFPQMFPASPRGFPLNPFIAPPPAAAMRLPILPPAYKAPSPLPPPLSLPQQQQQQPPPPQQQQQQQQPPQQQPPAVSMAPPQQQQAASPTQKKRKKAPGGPSTSKRRHRALEPLARFYQPTYSRGEYVECEWDDGDFFRATIDKAGKAYDVIYDSGEEETGVAVHLLRRPLAKIDAIVYLVTKRVPIEAEQSTTEQPTATTTTTESAAPMTTTTPSTERAAPPPPPMNHPVPMAIQPQEAPPPQEPPPQEKKEDDEEPMKYRLMLEPLTPGQHKPVWIDESAAMFLNGADRTAAIAALGPPPEVPKDPPRPAPKVPTPKKKSQEDPSKVMAKKLASRLEEIKKRWPHRAKEAKAGLAMSLRATVADVDKLLNEEPVTEEVKKSTLAALKKGLPKDLMDPPKKRRAETFSEFFGVAGVNANGVSDIVTSSNNNEKKQWRATIDGEFFELKIPPKPEETEAQRISVFEGGLDVGDFDSDVAAARARDWSMLALFFADPSKVLGARKQLVLNFVDSLHWFVDSVAFPEEAAHRKKPLPAPELRGDDARKAWLEALRPPPRFFPSVPPKDEELLFTCRCGRKTPRTRDDVDANLAVLPSSDEFKPAEKKIKKTKKNGPKEEVVVKKEEVVVKEEQTEEKKDDDDEDEESDEEESEMTSELEEALWWGRQSESEELPRFLREAALTVGGGEAAALDAFRRNGPEAIHVKSISHLVVASRRALLPAIPAHEATIRGLFFADDKKKIQRAKPQIFPVRELRQRQASDKARQAMKGDDDVSKPEPGTNNNNDEPETKKKTGGGGAKLLASSRSGASSKARPKVPVAPQNNVAEKKKLAPPMLPTGDPILDAAITACKPRQRARPMLTHAENGRVLAGPCAPTWDRLSFYVRDHPQWRLQRGVVPPLHRNTLDDQDDYEPPEQKPSTSTSRSRGGSNPPPPQRDEIVMNAERRTIHALRALDDAARAAATAAWQYSATLQTKHLGAAPSVHRVALDAAKAVAAIGGALADLRSPLPTNFHKQAKPIESPPPTKRPRSRPPPVAVPPVSSSPQLGPLPMPSAPSLPVAPVPAPPPPSTLPPPPPPGIKNGEPPLDQLPPPKVVVPMDLDAPVSPPLAVKSAVAPPIPPLPDLAPPMDLDNNIVVEEQPAT